MLFWMTCFALAALAGVIIVRTLLRAGNRETAENADVQVYRDQLAEIGRDAARGVIAADEADRARIEVSRRLIEADRAGPDSGTRGPVVLAAGVVAVALALAAAVYVDTGAPGYPDMPIASRMALANEVHRSRPSQAEAEARAAASRPAPAPSSSRDTALMERLRAAVKARPEDLTGQRLLARNEAALGNFPEAVAAQKAVIALAGDKAAASDFSALADTYVLAAGGYVSPEAEAAANEALKRDPEDGTALFYTGLMWWQTGRPDHTFAIWRDLLERGPEAAPWMVPVRAEIGTLAALAGVAYTPPPAAGAPGPDAADVEAAAGMSDADRQAMIEGMVQRLSDRLASEGGPPEDWAQLISALAVLGHKDRAAGIWAEAQTAFAGKDEALTIVREAAAKAGVGP